MNDHERMLLRYVCAGDNRHARAQARMILNGSTAKKDERFVSSNLEELDRLEAEDEEIPYNLRGMLVREDVSHFQEDRYILRKHDREKVEKLLQIYRVSQRLAEKGVQMMPSMLLHGVPGTGKTMLARYVAYQTGLPFVYVRFSGLVDSHLGETQKHLGLIFEYIRDHPCVLCFDEIDAVGIDRGAKSDVGEMSRITISLMQELDRFPAGAILIGTTNREDLMDQALLRRFAVQHKVEVLTKKDAVELGTRFFRSVYPWDEADGWLNGWLSHNCGRDGIPASELVSACLDMVVYLMCEEDGNGTDQTEQR